MVSGSKVAVRVGREVAVIIFWGGKRRVDNRWEEEEVNRRLERVMVDAFQAIWAIHKERNIPLRTAAFTLALQRVTRAHLHRGFD